MNLIESISVFIAVVWHERVDYVQNKEGIRYFSVLLKVQCYFWIPEYFVKISD